MADTPPGSPGFAVADRVRRGARRGGPRSDRRAARRGRAVRPRAADAVQGDRLDQARDQPWGLHGYPGPAPPDRGDRQRRRGDDRAAPGTFRRTARRRSPGPGGRLPDGRHPHPQRRRHVGRREPDRRPARGGQRAAHSRAGRRARRPGGQRDARHPAHAPRGLSEERPGGIRELETRLQDQGVKMDRYLEYTNTSLDVLRAEQRPQAVQKVRLELALETVAEREGLAVSDAEVEDAVNNALSEEDHTGHKHADLRTADPVRAYFRHQLLMRKTIEHLSALAAPESLDKMEPLPDVNELQAAGSSASAGGRPAGKRKER